MAVGLIKLVFGDTSLELSTDEAGGLEALTDEVQKQLDLHPGSFSLRDEFGKVADSMALQRALDMAGDGACVLHVCEAPEWKKIREMETKINMLVARCPVVDRVLLVLEDRSALRFEKVASVLQGMEERVGLRGELAVAELRQDVEELNARVSLSIAPLLQQVALQEMELKAKLDSLDASLFSQEMDTKVNSNIAPMLQSMALQQMDLKEKMDSMQVAPVCRYCDKLGEALWDTRKELVDVEEVTKDLQKEMGKSGCELQEAREQLKALQADVNNLSQPPAMSGERILSAMQQDLAKTPKSTKNHLGFAGDGDTQWLEGFSADLSSPIAFSKKSNSASVPFARFVGPRQLDRLQGSRSLPQLPPVR